MDASDVQLNSSRPRGSSFLSAGFVFLSFLTVPLHAVAQQDVARSQDAPTPNVLFDKLRERDHVFNDIALEYDKTFSNIVDLNKIVISELFRRSKHTRLDTGDDSADKALFDRLGKLPPPFRVDYALRESVVIQDDIVAFEHFNETRTVEGGDPELEKLFSEFIGSPAKRERWGLADGKLQSAVSTENRDLLFIASHASSLQTIEQQRMAVEFAFGFGFGKRLVRLESVEMMKDNTIRASGLISVWGSDESRCELYIDNNFIVRKAKIDCDVSGNLHSFESDSHGTFSDWQLPVLASSGHFKKRWLGMVRDGELKGVARDVEQFELRLVSATHPSNPAEFDRMTTFQEAKAGLVVDVTNNRTIRDNERIRNTLAPAQSRLWLVLINVLLIVILFVFLRIRRSSP